MPGCSCSRCGRELNRCGEVINSQRTIQIVSKGKALRKNTVAINLSMLNTYRGMRVEELHSLNHPNLLKPSADQTVFLLVQPSSCSSVRLNCTCTESSTHACQSDLTYRYPITKWCRRCILCCIEVWMYQKNIPNRDHKTRLLEFHAL